MVNPARGVSRINRAGRRCSIYKARGRRGEGPRRAERGLEAGAQAEVDLALHVLAGALHEVEAAGAEDAQGARQIEVDAELGVGAELGLRAGEARVVAQELGVDR